MAKTKNNGRKNVKRSGPKRGTRGVTTASAPQNRTRMSMLSSKPLGSVASVDKSMALQSKREEVSLMTSLYDPCHAELTHGPYRGARGFLNRFQSTITQTFGAADTASVFVWVPSTGVLSSATAANTGVNTPISLTTLNSPGNTYYTANANQTRSLGACVQVWSNLAPLNIAGNIALGTIPYSQIATTTSVANLILACNFKAKLTADVFEQKWYPAMQDEFYTQYNTAPSADAAGDTNALVVVLYGTPVSTTYTFNLTAITEWTPQPSLGMQTSNTTSISRVSPSEVVAKLHKVKPNWFTRVGNILSSAIPYVVAGTELAAGVAGLLI